MHHQFKFAHVLASKETGRWLPSSIMTERNAELTVRSKIPFGRLAALQRAREEQGVDAGAAQVGERVLVDVRMTSPVMTRAIMSHSEPVVGISKMALPAD